MRELGGELTPSFEIPTAWQETTLTVSATSLQTGLVWQLHGTPPGALVVMSVV